MKMLYRTYRPQNFKEIVNQNHIKITLQHEIESGRTAHAYLFCGPRGIGKTTVARIFAKSLNCLNRKEGEHEPCDNCEMCLDLINSRSLDIIEIDAASQTGVDNVRENIISASRIAPTRGKYKVFIIDEVHMLSIPAFNALLKLLEEPPTNTVFILCTTEAHKIPETIISRTERFDFKRINAADIVKKLQYIASKENIKIDDIILENIARQADGHMRDAESLLGQVISIGGKEISIEEADLVIPRSDINEVINLIELLAKKDAGTAIGLVNRLLDDGISLKRFIKEALEILRKILLIKIDQKLSEKVGLELGENIELRIIAIGEKFEINYVIRIIEKFLLLQNQMRNAFIEQLPLEIAIAELCMESGSANPSPYNFAKANNDKPAQIYTPSENIKNPQEQFISKNVANEAPKISETAEVSNSVDTNIDANLIYAKWNEVLAKIKSHNHSLSFILRACQPKDLKGNQLCLAFKYKFHKDRIADINIKQMVEKVLKDVYGCSITIETVVDEQMKVDENRFTAPNNIDNNIPPIEDSTIPVPEERSALGGQTPASASKSEDDVLSSVLKTFGGKIV
jgi:DNA polymerase III subunit gamma/tau